MLALPSATLELSPTVFELPLDMFELTLDGACHLLDDSAERQPGHDVSEKAQDDETLRLLLAQPSAQKIEERLGIELADRRTV